MRRNKKQLIITKTAKMLNLYAKIKTLGSDK